MFYDVLNSLMKSKNVSRQDLTTALSIGKNQIKYWETHENIPNMETLKKIADYFGVSVDYLLGNESNNAELPEQDKKVLQMLHSLDAEGKEKAEQYLELLSLQYKKSEKEKVEEIIKALPNKDDSMVTARIAAFGGGVREVKLSKDDLREIVNMLEKKKEN